MLLPRSAGVFALLMRTQLAQPNMQFVSDDTYNELFTMHGSTMIYLFVTPMAIALAMYLVPLQIGAPCVWRPAAGAGRLLDLALRRPGHAVGLAHRPTAPGATGWFVLHAALQRHQHAGRRAGPVGDRRDPGRRRDDR